MTRFLVSQPIAIAIVQFSTQFLFYSIKNVKIKNSIKSEIYFYFKKNDMTIMTSIDKRILVNFLMMGIVYNYTNLWTFFIFSMQSL